ncbi:FtsP/CotA-like multicopper oxidase with cupredoxin domain [Granulicella aggregans]|uniref:FtsP/CotA-like multicopper oxidase with cupredoxin domain n=1 Tax=Granulicella aggregans TaxID=474949 RepID=A0A7W7ZCK8_9BACT|nr:multicopper oxidase domain-containing protein [Granulicella aggregans]MBB5057268.1 FtsP/CotA-like multicopper oxidase with cupredoxin domain [Granulicella aggregans]
MNRRDFIQQAALTTIGPALSRLPVAAAPDYTLRIVPTTLEIGPKIEIRTTAYNGQVPGPILRVKENSPVTIDVTNATEVPEIVHWHGLANGTIPDGAVEEGSPIIAAGATLRYRFTPKPAGTRWYHTHAMAMDDLSRATYSGQYGFLLVEGNSPVPAYDQEVNLAIHHWNPSFVPMVETMRAESANAPQTSGSDVGYQYATINAHMLGAGEPLRVKPGQRVLMRLLNASATENVLVALPGHTFRVIAMDGNPVPNPRSVEVLSLAVAERIDAIVEMNNPGIWVLGSTIAAERAKGLGLVVEYANASGKPVWRDPAAADWDYSSFASARPVPDPAEIFILTFRDAGALDNSKFDTWTINGDAWPKVKPLMVDAGKRYRLTFRNASGDQHPMHLHRHSFEVVRIGEKSLSGLVKDVINVMPLQTVSVDFLADNPGAALLHCHQQLHMDYGFMQIIQYTAS